MAEPRLSAEARAAIKAGNLKNVVAANARGQRAGIRRSGIKKGMNLNPPSGVIR